jgi:hypothetical protein
MDQRLLRGVGAVAVQVRLRTMHQIRQRMLVMHVRRCHHCAVRQTRLAVHADVQLHTEEPLPVLAGRAHLRVAFALGILGRTRCTDDGRIHDGAGANLQAVGLQHVAHLRKQSSTEIVLFQQSPELQQRRRIRHPLATEVDADESPQRGAVEQRVLTSHIGQVKPVLNEVHREHEFKAHRRAAIAGFRIVRLDHAA